jgi:hypothetical protein
MFMGACGHLGGSSTMRTISGLASVRVVLAITVLSVAPRDASAAWPELGRAVSTGAGTQDAPRIATDGAAGAIITWHDLRSPTINILVQHVLASGDVDATWPADGRALLTDPAALATALAGQKAPVIVSDGAGGAIVAWQDGRSGVTESDIFAQHVLSSGAVDPGWPANGRALSTAAGVQVELVIVSDGAGGAIVAWMDGRSADSDFDIYAQHVLASGRVDPGWPAEGAALCTAPGPQEFPKTASDGAGGAIVTWTDFRLGGANADIFAQHVLSSGALDPAWPANGRALSLAIGTQFDPTIVSDGARGAIVAWSDARDGQFDIYAQRLLGSGAIAPGWPANGRAVCTAPLEQLAPVITSDGASGAIVSWQDLRNGANRNSFAQHVLASGAIDASWPVNGRALSLSPGDQSNASIVVDGAGGAIIAWEEDFFILVHHVQASGLLDPTFPIFGRFVRLLLTFQHTPDLVAAGAGTAIVAWSDLEPGADSDIYAMQVLAPGTVGPCDGTPASLPAEVDSGVRVERSGSATVLTWNVATRATASTVLRGRVSGLPVGSGGADEQCLADDAEVSTLTDSDSPPAGESFWYLVRGENACGKGPYGFEGAHGVPAAPRVSATCP